MSDERGVPHLHGYSRVARVGFSIPETCLLAATGSSIFQFLESIFVTCVTH